MVGNSEGLIQAIAVALASGLKKHGVTPEEGNATVRELCEALCQSWGGESHWLPKTYRPAREARVRESLQQGATLGQAARAAGIHPDTARRIAKRQSSGLGRDDWVI